MAVVLLFRVAIALAESAAGAAALRWVQSGGSTYFGSIEHGLEYAWKYLTDPDTPASVAQDALNSVDGPEDSPGWLVTDFPTPFELRKLMWRLSRAPTAGVPEDVAVCTFHFIKATGGTPGTYVDTTDLAAVETALNTYWNAIKGNFSTWMHSDQFRWYKDGPAFYQLNDAGTSYVPLPSGNPAIRVTEVDVAGGGSVGQLPPQCAITVTERTSARRHWGRWYLPNTSGSIAGLDGRLTSAAHTLFLASAVSFYNSCRAASMVPVVFSIQKPARPGAKGSTLPAVGAVAYEVISLQMDDIYDIIRSRRWGNPVLRVNTALT